MQTNSNAHRPLLPLSQSWPAHWRGLGSSKVRLSELVVWAVTKPCLQTPPKTFDTLPFPSMFKDGCRLTFQQTVENEQSFAEATYVLTKSLKGTL